MGNGAIVGFNIDTKRKELFVLKTNGPYSIADSLYKSTNNGENWINITPSDVPAMSWLGVSPFNHNEIYVKESHYIIAGWYETVYRSLDGGNNWQEITYFPASSHGRGIGFNFSLTDSSTLYAAVDDRMIDKYFFKSTDKGDNWYYISIPPVVEPELITDNSLPNRIFSFGNYYLTDDGGYTWAIADSGLPSIINLYLSFYFDPSNEDIYYNLTKQGLYKSNRNPIYWSLVEGSDSMPLNLGSYGFSYGEIGQLRNVFIDTSTNELYVGTASGIYKKNLVTGVKQVKNIQPTEFKLYQNYPNPFNPSTRISWQLPVGSWQTLKIYDILGKETATLIDQYNPAGYYEVKFNASNIPSGVYFYVLTAETGKGEIMKQGKKMLLIK